MSGFSIQLIELGEVGALDAASFAARAGAPRRVRIGARKTAIEGNPNPDHISTSFAERSNLNMRMHTRRFARLTNAFFRKVENHAHVLQLCSHP
jgi:hypothetical protein